MLLYFTASIVVIFYFKINVQRHFTHHRNEVSALSVSSNGLVASGERGKNPCIIIWNIFKREPIAFLRNDHKDDVYLLSFINEDKYLASCSLRLKPSVVVYNVETKQTILATFVDDFVRNISVITYLVAEFNSLEDFDDLRPYFFMFSRDAIFMFKFEKETGTYSLNKQSIDNWVKSRGLDLDEAGEVCAIQLMYLNQEEPILRGYSSRRF